MKIIAGLPWNVCPFPQVDCDLKARLGLIHPGFPGAINTCTGTGLISILMEVKYLGWLFKKTVDLDQWRGR